MSYSQYDLTKFIFIPSEDVNSMGIGLTALDSVTTGTNNTCIGTNTGTGITTGSNNLVIGTANSVDGITTGSNTFWLGAGTTAIMSATGTNATPTLTIPGNLVVSGTFSATGGSAASPVPVGSALTLTAASSGKYILLNTASGSVATLPAATGTGNTYRFIVSTSVTSNSHKILAASSSDTIMGRITTNVAGTATVWDGAVAAGYHSLAMNGTTTAGLQGDYLQVMDVATNVWTVLGATLSTGTAATSFSTSTT